MKSINDELDEILRKSITAEMGRAYFVETEGHGNDAEERHYENTEAGEEYRQMLVKQAKQAIQDLVRECTPEEKEYFPMGSAWTEEGVRMAEGYNECLQDMEIALKDKGLLDE